jgi:hypothetical protein
VLHGALQILHYDLIDMRKLTPQIQEVIAFTRWLSDKQTLRKCGLESGLHSHVWTLGTIVSPAPNFMQICTLVDHVIRNNFSFLEWGLTRPRLILKNQQPGLMVHTFQNLKNFEFDSRFGNSSTLRVS